VKKANQQIGDKERALVLGCHGGVGRALLALLEHSRPGRGLLQSIERLVLVDQQELPLAVSLPEAVLLPPTAVRSADDLAALVREHRITQVIDTSSVDTVECTVVCEDMGVDFLCTSVEEWGGGEPLATDEAIARLLPPRRPALVKQSHLVGSGANPGIVNALAFVALDEFATRVGAEPTVDALDLYAVLITEEDTTIEEGAAYEKGVFPMTWSPYHCLEELFEPVAFAARGGAIVALGHCPTDRWYQARCGDRLIEGMAVPHEEIATLARHLSTVEIGFIYRIPLAARQALAADPGNRSPQTWKTRRLYPPWTTALSGTDRVGVLLCSRRFGELWMGFDTDMSLGLQVGTNATQLQVAAGVVAGWSQLGSRKGIHFVEDLDWRRFIDVVSEVLGLPVVVHDPAAPIQSLADRARARSDEAARPVEEVEQEEEVLIRPASDT
jgi:saccharopine dehydrogenase-like NADP-dependent oxidoreductase